MSGTAGAISFYRGEDPLRAEKLNAAFVERLLRAGDSMAGPLLLAGDPVQQLEAVTKQYADGIVARSVLVATGDIPPVGVAVNTLWWDSAGCQLYILYDDGNSTQWVPAFALSSLITAGFLPLAGGTLSGPLILAANPSTALGAATRQYVDASVGAYLPLAGGALSGGLSIAGTLSATGAASAASITTSGTAIIGTQARANNFAAYVPVSAGGFVGSWQGDNSNVGFRNTANTITFGNADGSGNWSGSTRATINASGDVTAAGKLTASGDVTSTGGNVIAAGGVYANSSTNFGLFPSGVNRYLRFDNTQWGYVFNTASGARNWQNGGGSNIETLDGSGNFTASGTIRAGASIYANGGVVCVGPDGDYALLRSGGDRYIRWSGNWGLRWDSSNGNLSFQDYADTQLARLEGNGTLALNYGNAFKPGGGPWITTSDERVKKSMQEYTSGLAQVLQLLPIVYSFNGKGGTRDDGTSYIGLSAQATQPVMPEMVVEMADDPAIPGQLALDSGPLLFALVNCIKELTARIQVLEARHV